MRLGIVNRQRKIRFSLRKVRAMAEAACPDCLSTTGPGEKLLSTFDEVNVSIISDRAIARVHADFLHSNTPTDVITFSHGEILIGAGSAHENASRFGQTIEQEIARYVVHGMLHLNGFRDGTRRDAQRMEQVQERILSRIR